MPDYMQRLFGDGAGQVNMARYEEMAKRYQQINQHQTLCAQQALPPGWAGQGIAQQGPLYIEGLKQLGVPGWSAGVPFTNQNVHQEVHQALVAALEARVQDQTNQIIAQAAYIAGLERKIAAAERRRVVMGDEPAPDYHGPMNSDGTPMPDQDHESFYESVKDVVAGRIMPKAMRQMKDVIDKASAQAPVVAKSLSRGALSGETRDRRRIGWV